MDYGFRTHRFPYHIIVGQNPILRNYIFTSNRFRLAETDATGRVNQVYHTVVLVVFGVPYLSRSVSWHSLSMVVLLDFFIFGFN